MQNPIKASGHLWMYFTPMIKQQDKAPTQAGVYTQMEVNSKA